MNTNAKICGYVVGRFVPSVGSYFLSEQPSSASPFPRHRASWLSVLTEPATTAAVAVEGTGVCDVGRERDGSLVILSSEREAGKTLDLGGVSDDVDDRISDHGSSSRLLFDRPSPAEVELAKSEENAIDQNASPLRDYFRRTYGRLAPILEYPFVARLRESPLFTVQRVRRVVIPFFVLAVAVTALIWLVPSNAGESSGHESFSGAPALGTPALGSATLGTPFPKETRGDPVDFAVHAIGAGDVAALSPLVSETSALEGRVLSRNGEFVLIEMTILTEGKTTIATLLVQGTESGWRTREVFESID
jgi:hypothetical protein